MAEWLIGTWQEDAAPLGMRLAQMVPGEWSELRDGPIHGFGKRGDHADGRDEARLVARALLTYLTVDQKPRALARIVQRHYPSFAPDERDRIAALAHARLERTPRLERRRRRALERRLTQFCREHALVLAEGAMTFLLADQRALWERAVDDAVDDWLFEREEADVVHWLRQYRDGRPVACARLQVFGEVDGVAVEDDGGTRLHWQAHDPEAGEDGLLAVLLTLAPAELLIHQGVRAPARRLIDAVFGSEATSCPGCPRCPAPRRRQAP